jgi:hypothetical protein
VFAIGCGDQPTTAPNAPSTPRFDISDGAHDNGNDGFFFLPPMVKEPVTNSKYKDEAFHGGMRPHIVICALESATHCVEGQPFKGFASEQISVGNEQYHVNWDTKEKPLVDGTTYRIQVFVGDVRLGYADVQHADNRAELKNLDTQEFVPLVDGRTLPIKFRIESGALCVFNAVCTSSFVDKDVGGTFYAADEGAAIDFDPGVLPVDVVVTVERIPVPPGAPCVAAAAAASVVFAQWEGCYRITTTPDIAPFGGFQGPTEGNPARAIVAVCIEPDVPENLRDNLLLHKFDQGGDPEVTVPEQVVPPFEFPCDDFEGTSLPSGAFGAFTRDAFGVLASALSRLVGPRPLYAVDGGLGCILAFGGALSTFFWGLPVEAEEFGGNGQEVTVGTAAQAVSVRALAQHSDGDHSEENPEPVSGVPVTFEILGSLGELRGSGGAVVASIVVTTDVNGIATLPAGAWVMSGTLGTHQLRASGPFVTGAVDFTATAIESGAFSIATLQSELEYPKGLWIKNGYIYITETRGRNTTFSDGRVSLLRIPVGGSEADVLLNNPVNSDAVVVADDGKIYLTSYHTTIPGENGDVSVVEFFEGEGWQESHLLDLEIAAIDMFMDSDENIYVIGSSDGPAAKSLYRLPVYNYVTEANVLESGLGRTQALTRIGSTFYYAHFVEPEVRTLPGDEVFIDNATVYSLTSDGTYLYYAEVLYDGPTFVDSWIRRKHLATGAVETIADLAAEVTAVRFDAETGTLFFLEGGTQGNEFRDGALKSIAGLAPPPPPPIP